MKSPILSRIPLVLCLVGMSAPLLHGQTWNERISLRDALNTAKSNLTLVNPVEIITLDNPAYGIDSLRDDLNGCRVIRAGEDLTLSYNSFTSSFTLSHLTKESGTIQVPVESHRFVCNLNDWLKQSWVGVFDTDTAQDKYGFDDLCTDNQSCPSCQSYFMRNIGGLSVTYWWLVPWVWFPSLPYTAHMEYLLGPPPPTITTPKIFEPDLDINEADLCYSDHKDVLMSWRKQPVDPLEPDSVFHKRAHFSLEFDYNKTPDPAYGYVFPSGTYPEIGWTKNRLKSIELIFQYRAYSPNACPPGTIDPDYDPSVAKVTVNVEYNNGGSSQHVDMQSNECGRRQEWQC